LDPKVASVDNITSAKLSLDTLKLHFNLAYRKTIQERDQHIKELSKTLGSDAVFELNREYHNKGLEALVTNRNEFQKIDEVNDRLIRRFEPIYSLPTSNMGRAQLFAAYKHIGGYYIPTLWFNVFVIWVMTGVFYSAIWSDMFRVVNKLVERFRFRKLTTRISRYLPS
jgi:hypothetical protein